ncbi:oxidoreductase [Streptomyces capparidis]
MAGWSAADIPALGGRVAVVTGANSGIGYCTARELARRGAAVVLACRDRSRGEDALTRLKEEVPGADAALARLDLADLASVRAFADGLPHDGLDLLVNNAGVMALPRGATADGFETQFGVNHLGHFALTGLLLPRLLARPGARVVNVSSVLHLLANVDLGDLNSERRYRRWVAYGRSKSANLLFTHALARRAEAAGAELTAVAAHPGYASTNLGIAGARMTGQRLKERVYGVGNRVFAQSAADGALPTLYAATAPGVPQDAFIGPGLLMRGAPTESPRARWTRDGKAAELLWSASEQLTGVRYEGL